jgi:hypothetical protein
MKKRAKKKAGSTTATNKTGIITAKYAVGVTDGNVEAWNIDVDWGPAYFRADLKLVKGDCCNQMG